MKFFLLVITLFIFFTCNKNNQTGSARSGIQKQENVDLKKNSSDKKDFNIIAPIDERSELPEE